MKKGGIIIVVCSVLFVLFSTSSQVFAASKTLSLMTWEGYVTDELIAEFQEETGIKVEVTYVADNNEFISKLRATGGEGYDIAQPSSIVVMTPQKDYSIFQPIDLSRVQTLGNMIPTLFETVKAHTSIEGKLYALPYTWGTSGVIVNTNKIKKAVYSYRDIYDEKWCGRATTRYRFPTFAGAGYGLGWNYFENYEDPSYYRNMMENILAFLVSKKKCMKTYWTTRQENIDLMAKEECWISQGWDGTGFLLTQKYPHIKYFAPKEGALGWIDTFVISAGAENLDGTYKWINFMMTPERGGKLTKGGGFMSAVKGASGYVPPELTKLIEKSFPPHVIENIKWYPVTLGHVREIEAEMEERLKQAR